ncbi:hypothetical protein RHSIM_Rhsim08G0054500 [Rhododendron simsii]|uniref:GDSL esterase/lipase n=1 Tax=Rhododendron simsii TaxID=118357 RepID=A0A834GNM3_RHOSS|nr:hypothetical protein RHSIM_Rhsim08G0054500 [Rhododendron simsii]
MASSGLGSVWALGWLFLTVMVGGESIGTGSSSGKNCGFPAIFNFGDSNSDAGTGSAAFVELLPPYGMSFRNLSKRASDGRLIIDFIAENLGLPYLDGALDSIGTSFNHGANFATGGAKVSPVVIHGSTIPLHLDIQVSEFLQFKSRTVAQQKRLGNNSNNLPVAEVFPNALYTIDIGQNDVVANVDSSFIPTIIEQFSCSPQRLLKSGAKFLWIHNTGPQGCSPNDCIKKSECLVDQNGCVISQNEQSTEFNKQLKQMIYKLRAQYPDAAITYVDVYTAKHTLIVNAKDYSVHDPFTVCCGNGFMCAQRDFNQTLLGTACTDPSRYVNWDGMHYTEAANRFVAQLVVNGSLSDPPLLVAEACRRTA